MQGFAQMLLQNINLLWAELIMKATVKEEHAVCYCREPINKNSSLSTFSCRKFEDIQALMSQKSAECQESCGNVFNGTTQWEQRNAEWDPRPVPEECHKQLCQCRENWDHWSHIGSGVSVLQNEKGTSGAQGARSFVSCREFCQFRLGVHIKNPRLNYNFINKNFNKFLMDLGEVLDEIVGNSPLQNKHS